MSNIFLSVLYLLIWYLLTSFVGWIIFPFVFHLFPTLADRGYAFSRTMGLLLWGFAFWLLASLGFLYNNSGGLLFALGILILLSIIFYRSINIDDIKKWWTSNRRMVIIVEVLFIISFVFMAFIRSANPEIEGTEKPMELAFINAILHSPNFPPHDPWLSGYAISYYYFGYILIGMLAKLTGVPGNYAFNLGISLVFALSSIGAYGLVYDLLNHRFKEKASSTVYSALLGPLFVLIISNLEGFLHSLHSRGLFWSLDANGQYTSAFWSWLDINNLNVPPTEPLTWVPTQFWWWWRASRVLQDYNYAGAPLEIIDEFPFFSFLLGDLHPHVLAIPFAFLAMVMALNIFLISSRGRMKQLHLKLNLRTIAWIWVLVMATSLLLLVKGYLALSLTLVSMGIISLLAGITLAWYLLPLIGENGWDVFTKNDIAFKELNLPLRINVTTFLIAAVIVGGMAFLNTWDVLVAIVLVAGAYTLGGIFIRGDLELFPLLRDFTLMSLALGITSIAIYLPFYLGFSPQAGGPLPNLIFPTRGAHLWVMFAPLLIPIFAFLIYLLRHRQPTAKIKKAALLITLFILTLWALSFLLGILIVNLPEVGGIEVGSFYLNFLAAPNSSALFKQAITRRLVSSGGWITLTLLLIATVAVLLKLDNLKQEKDHTSIVIRKTDAFVLGLILVGAMLVLGAEFFYLRDQFGWRMNTIFKFYYQTWLLWAIAAAYSSAVLLKVLKSHWSLIYSIILIAVIFTALVYPFLSVWSKTNGLHPNDGWTLNGTLYLDNRNPDEMAAIKWLQTAPPGIIAEAISPTGGSYQWPPGYARVSTLSGLPTVLGWAGHESQWRGGNAEMGSRQADIEQLYCSRDINLTFDILERYNIRYIFIGPLEHSTYQPNGGSCPAGLIDSKFENSLVRVFQNGQVRIYEVPDIEN